MQVPLDNFSFLSVPGGDIAYHQHLGLSVRWSTPAPSGDRRVSRVPMYPVAALDQVYDPDRTVTSLPTVLALSCSRWVKV